MEKKFRVAMVGAGCRANQVTYPAFYGLEDVEIVAICDIDKERLNETADKYHVEKRYGDHIYSYRDMIEETKPDAVVVIGQPDVMYPIWVWVLEHNYPLFIEKPLALTIHQARSLAKLAEDHNCVTAVSLQRRTTPVVMQMRDKCLERGPITHALCRFYKCMIEDNFNSRDHMMDDCVHSIDTLRWICGGEVVKIESFTKRVQVHDINFISATLHFDNGSTGYLINSWSTGKRIFSVEMHAPNIYAEVEHEIGGRIYADGDTVGVEYSATEAAQSDKFEVYTGVSNLAREFVDCCKNHTQPQTNFTNEVKTMEIAEKILAQALLADR